MLLVVEYLPHAKPSVRCWDTMSNKTQNCLKELTDRFLRGSDTNYAKLQELFFIAPATLTFMYLSNKLFIIYVF